MYQVYIQVFPPLWSVWSHAIREVGYSLDNLVQKHPPPPNSTASLIFALADVAKLSTKDSRLLRHANLTMFVKSDTIIEYVKKSLLNPILLSPNMAVVSCNCDEMRREVSHLSTDSHIQPLAETILEKLNEKEIRYLFQDMQINGVGIIK